MITNLIKIADELDKRSLFKEANFLDVIIKKIADDLEMPSSTRDLLGSNVGTDWLQVATEQGVVDPPVYMAEDSKNKLVTPIDNLDDLTEIIIDVECDLKCAEDAALKYRSSLNYQENEDIEKEIVNALVDSKRPDPGMEA